MEIFTVKNKPFDSNMYIVTLDGKNGVIIDLGADFSVAKAVLDAHNLTPACVILTHCHYDHVNGIKSARAAGLDVWISSDDAKSLEDPKGTLAEYVGVTYAPISDYKTFTEGQYLFGDIPVSVIPTRGHTKGSVTFLIEDCLFTGDTLFHGCVGRCDLPSGSDTDMQNSVNRLIGQLFTTKTNFKVYPGHGRPTDLLTEYNTNPYIKQYINDTFKSE